MQFIVIIPMHNSERWIGSNIQTLRNQTYTNFRCFIGDDLSTDASAQMARKLIRGDTRFSLIEHRERKYSMGNIHCLIEQSHANDDDIIVLIDGDDRLAGDTVLQYLADIYAQTDCWMTYGTFSKDGLTPDPSCKPYPFLARRHNLFRLFKWRASHLKTFRYFLWKKIPENCFSISQQELEEAKRRALLLGRWRKWHYWRDIELRDILDPSKNFARRCSDKNLTIPMLHIAGERTFFVKEILYHYTPYEKELDFDKEKCAKDKWFVRLIRDIILHKPKPRALDTEIGTARPNIKLVPR